MVDQEHRELAAVPAVDDPRGVHDAQPDAHRQPGTGRDQSDVPRRDGDGDPGGHETALAGGQRDRLPGVEIGPGIAGVGVAGHREPGVETAQ